MTALSGKKTYILMALALITAWGTYLAGEATIGQAITATFAALGGATLRGGVTAEVKKIAAGVALLFCLTACAAPQSEQGKSAQGGSVTAPPIALTVNIGTGGGVTTTLTSAPTAAPASASTASAAQTATNDIKPDVALGDSALKAISGADKIPVLGGEKKKPVVEVPVVVTPAPVEPPAPPAPADRP